MKLKQVSKNEIRQIVIKIMEYTHIHIHPQAKSSSPTKIKYKRFTWQTKKIKNYIYHLRAKLKHKLKNKTKARYQVGNNAMKTKLTNMLRRKERKEE